MTKQKCLLKLFILGRARWEPFKGDAERGELCVGGLRYATHLDRDGVPNIHSVAEHAIRSELGRHRGGGPA